MSHVPAVGDYWSKVAPPENLDLASMRRGGTQRFDNAAWPIALAAKTLWPLIRKEYVPLAADNGLGNPPRRAVNGVLASVGSIEFAAMSSVCFPLLEDLSRARVLEIGGGYGGFASAGLRAGVEAWTIVDLPTVARCSRWYLSEFGSRARVISPEEFAGEDRTYDLVVQTRGFMEMSGPEIKFYFDRIQGDTLRTGGLFFTINRKRKVSRFADYPFDGRWKVLHSDVWPESNEMAMVVLKRTDTETGDIPGLLARWK